MVYPAFHLSYVPIPQSDLYLLLQAMRGAVDIVLREFVQDLEHFGSSDANGLSDAEIDMLKRRGYLTDLPPEQELEQASTILNLFSRNLQPLVELSFDLSVSSGDSSDLVDKLFLLANSIAGEQGAIKVYLEISPAPVDEQVMARILDQAHLYRSTVIPRLTIAGFKTLTPWLKSENFRQALLISDRESLSLAIDSVANNNINFFKQQIQLVWRCDLDGMSPEQLAAVVAIIQRVREKYPFFNTRLISGKLGVDTTENFIPIDGTFLPYISPDNEPVFNTLMSLVLMPKRINYYPFFFPDAHKLACELHSKRVNYKSPSGDVVSGGLDEIMARVESANATQAIKAEAPLIQERVTCKYALICGCQSGMNGCSNDRKECAAVFEQRLHQVLPLLVFNIQQWKGRAASATNE